MPVDTKRTPTTERPPGRPRDPDADEAILAATLGILADQGYAGLTMDRIAEQAGVSKPTIYRRWPSKEDVVLAAVERLSQAVPVPDTGSTRGDLEAITRGLTAVFAAPQTARLVGALVARIEFDPKLGEAMRSGFLATRRAAALTALERGRRRGEVRADIDLETAVDLLAAPFYYRLLITGAPIDDGFARTVVDAVLTWVSPGNQRDPQ